LSFQNSSSRSMRISHIRFNSSFYKGPLLPRSTEVPKNHLAFDSSLQVLFLGIITGKVFYRLLRAHICIQSISPFLNLLLLSRGSVVQLFPSRHRRKSHPPLSPGFDRLREVLLFPLVIFLGIMPFLLSFSSPVELSEDQTSRELRIRGFSRHPPQFLFLLSPPVPEKWTLPAPRPFVPSVETRQIYISPYNFGASPLSR